MISSALAIFIRVRPGSPWMPIADLHLVVAELEGRLAGGRDGAAREGHAHRADVVLDLLAERRHRREVGAGLGGRADDLLGQDGPTDAAAARGVERVLDRDVVRDDDAGDLDPLGPGHLGRELEVHDVAGVVLDDVQDAGAAVDRLRRGEHLVRHRRGEDGAGAGGIEHAHPDEAAVHRLVAAAAARDHADLAGLGGVGAHDDVGLDDADEVPVRRHDADQRVVDDGVGAVDELLHPFLLWRCAGCSGTCERWMRAGGEAVVPPARGCVRVRPTIGRRSGRDDRVEEDVAGRRAPR